MKIAEQMFEVVFSCAKWKLLQVVCTQPFNKTMHFGLSCLVFETKQIETHTDNHFDVDGEQRNGHHSNGNHGAGNHRDIADQSSTNYIHSGF